MSRLQTLFWSKKMRSNLLLKFFVLSILAAGCGNSDPADSVLPVGSQAVVTGDGTRLDTDADLLIYPKLEPGVIVRVGNDPGFYQESELEFNSRLSGESVAEAKVDMQAGPHHFENGVKGSEFRKIAVTVETGRYQGVSGKVRRNDIAPVK